MEKNRVLVVISGMIEFLSLVIMWNSDGRNAFFQIALAIAVVSVSLSMLLLSLSYLRDKS